MTSAAPNYLKRLYAKRRPLIRLGAELTAINYTHRLEVQRIDAEERRIRMLLGLLFTVAVFGPTIAFLWGPR